jgi:hypothetical protein
MSMYRCLLVDVCRQSFFRTLEKRVFLGSFSEEPEKEVLSFSEDPEKEVSCRFFEDPEEEVSCRFFEDPETGGMIYLA